MPENGDVVIDDIAAGFAQALFVSAWVSAYEQENCRHKRPWGPGAEILDFAPTVPQSVRVYAQGVLVYIGAINGNRKVENVYIENLELPGHLTPPTPHNFGWYLGMEWTGEGVSWSDDHPDHGLRIRHGEFHLFLSDEDPRRVSIHAPGLQASEYLDR